MMMSAAAPLGSVYDVPVRSSGRNHLQNGWPTGSKSSSYSVAMSQEHYSETSMTLELKSKDGDMVSFNYKSIEYSRSVMAGVISGDPEKVDKLVSMVKENLEKIHEQFINSLFGDIPQPGEVATSEGKETTKELAIPEYWNAENTSQRITDFALSFIDLYEGDTAEYLSIIKDAIDEGFTQARELMGDVTDEVTALINDTYDMVLQNLADWEDAQQKVLTAA